MVGAADLVVIQDVFVTVAEDGRGEITPVLREEVFAVEERHGRNVVVVPYKTVEELVAKLVVFGEDVGIASGRLKGCLDVGDPVFDDIDGIVHGAVGLTVHFLHHDHAHIMRLPEAKADKHDGHHHEHDQRRSRCHRAIYFLSEVHFSAGG